MTHASRKQLAERLDFADLDDRQRQTLAGISPAIVASRDAGLDADLASRRQAQHWRATSSANFDAQHVDAVPAIGRTHA